VALACFAVFCLVCVFLPPRFTRDAYLASIIDKHRFLASAKSPKIVFVGGSNLAFGIDSMAISRVFGENVVNMGVSRNFGMRYQLEEVKDFVHSGDTIVIVPEYDNFRGDTGGSPYLLNVPLLFPSALKWVWRSYAYSPAGIWHLASDSSGYITGKWNYWRKGIYQTIISKNFHWPETMRLKNPGEPSAFGRAAFTVFGDFRGQTCLPNATQKILTTSAEAIDTSTADMLNDFDRFASDRGASVVLVPPALPDDVYQRHKKLFDETFAFWVNNLHFPVVGRPENYLFAQDRFYNSLYHLHDMPAIEEHTRRMVRDLSTYAMTAFHAKPGSAQM